MEKGLKGYRPLLLLLLCGGMTLKAAAQAAKAQEKQAQRASSLARGRGETRRRTTSRATGRDRIN